MLWAILPNSLGLCWDTLNTFVQRLTYIKRFTLSRITYQVRNEAAIELTRIGDADGFAVTPPYLFWAAEQSHLLGKVKELEAALEA